MSETMEFQDFPKMARLSRDVIVTEILTLLQIGSIINVWTQPIHASGAAARFRRITPRKRRSDFAQSNAVTLRGSMQTAQNLMSRSETIERADTLRKAGGATKARKQERQKHG